MNAKEAKLTAQKRASEIEKKRNAKEQKEAEDHAKKWKEQRENWFQSELACFERNIAEAVDHGKNKTSIWLDTHDKREWAEEDVFWKSFSYKPELKKVLKHFEELGYTLKYRIEDYRNVDLSDLSPRDDWYTYRSMMDISW